MPLPFSNYSMNKMLYESQNKEAKTLLVELTFLATFAGYYRLLSTLLLINSTLNYNISMFHPLLHLIYLKQLQKIEDS